MNVNKERPHLLILPEDDAAREVANGFRLMANGAMRVLGVAGGWPRVLSEFGRTYIAYLRKYAGAHLVLFIDFDTEFPARFALFQSAIPSDIADRVYVLGASDEVETLVKQVKLNKEKIGMALAEECRKQAIQLWGCAELQHNAPEVQRVCLSAHEFLF